MATTLPSTLRTRLRGRVLENARNDRPGAEDGNGGRGGASGTTDSTGWLGVAICTGLVSGGPVRCHRVLALPALGTS